MYQADCRYVILFFQLYHNVIIPRLVDHGLHIDILTPQYHFLCHRYEFFFVPPHRCYDLIFLILTWLHISTSSFWNRSPMHHMWAKAICFDCRLTKTTYRLTLFWTRLGLTLGTLTSASTMPSWRQSNLAMSCGNNAKVEGLDVTLDDSASYTRTDSGEWSDISAWFISEWFPS